MQNPEKQNPEKWINAGAAAERLGVDRRSVLRWAKAGRLKSKDGVDPETHQPAKLLHAGDVERLGYEREHPETALVPAKPQTPAIAPVDRRAIAAPAAPRMWITLEEAADYSGLPEGFLRDLIRAGKLPALDVGKWRGGGQWRVARRDLDAIQGELQGLAPVARPARAAQG